MLYPKNGEGSLSRELFRSPTSEYRATPFWAWNGKLETEELGRQIDIFRRMGFGGFHMHVRTGMDTSYLTPEFMGFVRFCVEKARDDQMLAWLYDEDRWPSGTAGGRVTADHPEYAAKTLLFTPKPYSDVRCANKGSRPGTGRGQERQENGELLAVYDILLNPDGTLAKASRIEPGAAAEGDRWYAYMEHGTDDPWFNDHPYVDTLNPDAIAEFLRTTHEVYYSAFREDFGGLIPAIFTDEPQFSFKNTLDFALEKKDLFLPWTNALPDRYESRFGENLLDRLPELIWELPDGALSPVRWRYQNVVTDLFVSSFCRQIGSWCDAHGIALTGHVMSEPTLSSQTKAVGEAMRCYRSFGIPGIDMLCDFHEYTTAKQCQSIVRQSGKEGMLSELYGVTGWNYDFRGHKLQGDWQAALGVTVRVPHLAWMTMKGEAKRDYPASLSYQSPWWDQYAMVEDHFARLNTALTRGKAVVRVAVIHPIESYWLHWGPSNQTEGIRRQMEQQFLGLTETLLFGSIDFDYISEEELPALCPEASAPLQVGQMAYDAVIVPALTTIRSTTLDRLAAFRKAGGTIISIGDAPRLVDAIPSARAAEILSDAVHVGFDASSILAAVEPFRFVDIRREDGSREDRLLYQLRQDGNCEWLFVCNGKKPVSPDVDRSGRLRFTIRGEFAAEWYDTQTGEVEPLSVSYQDGCTVLERQWHMHDSMLLKLVHGRSDVLPTAKEEPLGVPSITLENVPVRLEEPNMLLLDIAEYSLNGGSFHPSEELLRLDNAARKELGITLRLKEIVQPYLVPEEHPADRLTLRFSIPSEIELADVRLALEDREHTRIVWNTVEVTAEPDGWFVDRCIQTVALPGLRVGMNILELTVPIGQRTNLEWCYLLGDFGVRVNGTVKTVTQPVRGIGFGDIMSQGLPFYTGNLLYSMRVKCDGAFTVRIPAYRGALVKVFVDGEDKGNIAYSPYTLRIEAEAGIHTVELRLYGTRQNGFGQLHHTSGIYFYQSPNSWRSAGDFWTYEYQFRPAGIWKSPEFYGALVLGSDGKPQEVPVSYDHMTDLN